MISSGIGVTPCLSLAKLLLQQHKRGRRLSDIRFVWAVRDLNMAMCLSFFPKSSKTDRSIRSPDSLAAPVESTCLLSPSRSSSSSSSEKRRKNLPQTSTRHCRRSWSRRASLSAPPRPTSLLSSTVPSPRSSPPSTDRPRLGTTTLDDGRHRPCLCATSPWHN